MPENRCTIKPIDPCPPHLEGPGGCSIGCGQKVETSDSLLKCINECKLCRLLQCVLLVWKYYLPVHFYILHARGPISPEALRNTHADPSHRADQPLQRRRSRVTRGATQLTEREQESVAMARTGAIARKCLPGRPRCSCLPAPTRHGDDLLVL